MRDGLLLVQQARTFAAELGLDVGGQYTSFVDWPGDRIVTTVVATQPGEVTPAGFHFPLIGTLPYKGFFDPERARAESQRLRDQGLDVCEFGVQAYSTLGWLDDPVTGPMLRRDLGELLETILHELVHATVYVKNHADFNEGVASFIGEEGSVRFYERNGLTEKAARRHRAVAEGRLVDRELLRLRDEVSDLYADSEPGEQRDRRRAALEQQTRERIASLNLRTHPAGLADGVRLNDACLSVTGTYSQDTERYEQRLIELGGDLSAFIARLAASADAEDPTLALLEGP